MIQWQARWYPWSNTTLQSLSRGYVCAMWGRWPSCSTELGISIPDHWLRCTLYATQWCFALTQLPYDLNEIVSFPVDPVYLQTLLPASSSLQHNLYHINCRDKDSIDLYALCIRGSGLWVVWSTGHWCWRPGVQNTVVRRICQKPLCSPSKYCVSNAFQSWGWWSQWGRRVAPLLHHRWYKLAIHTNAENHGGEANTHVQRFSKGILQVHQFRIVRLPDFPAWARLIPESQVTLRALGCTGVHTSSNHHVSIAIPIAKSFVRVSFCN